MTQYAYFDSTVASPSPVLGWYDTALGYTSLPAAANLLAVTTAQWAARLASPGAWAVSNGALVPYTPAPAAPSMAAAAKLALSVSDRVIIRCYEHAVAVPADWAAYRAALRTIAAGTVTVTALPTAPAYPTGT